MNNLAEASWMQEQWKSNKDMNGVIVFCSTNVYISADKSKVFYDAELICNSRFLVFN